MTKKVVNSLSEQADILVIENSTFDDLRFTDDSNCKIKDLGSDNIGYGGCLDYILQSEIVDNYEFVGIFNNDIFDIPSDFIEKQSIFLNDNIGIVHAGLIDAGCPYGWMIYRQNSPSIVCMPESFIENVAPIISSKVLKEFSKYTPTHYYGHVDKELNCISASLNLINIVTNDTHLSHMRGGVRDSLQIIDNNKLDYFENWKKTKDEWLNNNPAIKKLIKKYKSKDTIEEYKKTILECISNRSA